ncbi:MAG: hypothetical protein WBZ36_26380 [Candidatus Nitrosopolaris sp.]
MVKPVALTETSEFGNKQTSISSDLGFIDAKLGNTLTLHIIMQKIMAYTSTMPV